MIFAYQNLNYFFLRIISFFFSFEDSGFFFFLLFLLSFFSGEKTIAKNFPICLWNKKESDTMKIKPQTIASVSNISSPFNHF